MEGQSTTTDVLERQLIEDEYLIARLRARQMQALAELDVRQVAMADGSRSLSEWLSARVDTGPDTSKTLVQTMRRLQDRPDLADELAAGHLSFDRVEALSRIPEDVGNLEWADVSGIRRQAARRARITAAAESRTVEDRYLVMQPSLDESWWRIWGGLDGFAGELVDKVLSQAADSLDVPDKMSVDAGWKRATALVESLVSDDPSPTQLTVFVDARDAAPTSGESGVSLESGARVGRQALQAILCDADVEVTARTSDGRFMEYGRRRRTAPPALKRALMAEAGHTCSADGCQSRNRLQVHHLTPWAQGGLTNQTELIVLCWFHHHVVIHERGLQPILHPDRRRIRFRHPERAPPT